MIAVGGLVEFASGNRAKLIRFDKETGRQREYALRLSNLLKKGESEANVLLDAGRRDHHPREHVLRTLRGMSAILEELRAALWSVWNRRWLALAVAWGLCLVGWLAVALFPNTYESQARHLRPARRRARRSRSGSASATARRTSNASPRR